MKPSFKDILSFSFLSVDMLVDIKRDVSHQYPSNSSQAKSIVKQLFPEAPEGDPGVKRSVPSLEPIIALVVIACNRPDYIRQTLDTLLK